MAKVENTAGFENVTTSKPEIDSEAAAISIAKPGAFDLNKFKSKRAAAMAVVARAIARPARIVAR